MWGYLNLKVLSTICINKAQLHNNSVSRWIIHSSSFVAQVGLAIAAIKLWIITVVTTIFAGLFRRFRTGRECGTTLHCFIPCKEKHYFPIFTGNAQENKTCHNLFGNAR
jgi:hypothetical protein